MSELLPCPFCGGPALIENVKGKAVDELRRSAGCDNEECHGYMSMQTYPRIADAVKAWNTRHPEPAQAQVSDAEVEAACVAAYSACDMGSFPAMAVEPDSDRRIIRAALEAAARARGTGEALAGDIARRAIAAQSSAKEPT